MIALDTNVLVRYYLDDDQAQAAAAARLLVKEDVFVAKTVLLEFEWVMRGVAKLTPSVIAKLLAHLLSLPNVRVEDPAAVTAAFDAYVGGMDFADALHVASANTAERFATFDARLKRRAVRHFRSPDIVTPTPA